MEEPVEEYQPQDVVRYLKVKERVKKNFFVADREKIRYEFLRYNTKEQYAELQVEFCKTAPAAHLNMLNI